MAINIQQVGNAPIAPPTQPTLQQEAFTAVLPTTENLNQDILKANQVNLAMKEAEKQRKDKEMADKISMFKFDTSGVWDKDTDAIYKKVADLNTKFYNPDFLKRYDSGDPNAINEFDKAKMDIQSDIIKSKTRLAYYANFPKVFGKDEKYNTPQNQQSFKEFVETPLADLPEMQIAYDYNHNDVINYITPKSEKNENGVVTTDETALDKIGKKAEGFYNGGIPTPTNTPFLKNSAELIYQATQDLAQRPQGGTMFNPIITYYDPTDLSKGIKTEKQILMSSIAPSNPFPLLYAKETIDPAHSKSVTTDEPKTSSNLNIDLGNGVTVPTNALDRYKFIREGLIDKPENLTSLLIGGKLNGGTITKVDRQLAKVEMNGAVPKGIGKKYDLVLTYDKDGAKKTYTITVDPETSQGVLEINNILNQIREGTSQFVNPEDINKIYQSDYKIGDVLESVQPSKTTPTSGTQQQGGVTDLGNIFGTKK